MQEWQKPNAEHLSDEKAPGNREDRSAVAGLYEWVGAAIFSLTLVALVFAFLFRIVGVVGSSMVPTLHEGDRLIVTIADMKINGPQRFDVVITHFPDSDKRYVKRVIALPGETLEIRDGVTYIDGEPLDEPFVTHPSTSDFGPYTVPEGQYMVLGDNRSNSHDSRADDVGPVDEDMIIGKVRFIMWPFSHFGVVE